MNKLQNRTVDLKDMDYDTGQPTMPGEYGLADKTYVELLDKLQDNKFIEMTQPLQQNLLNFYNKADTVQLALKYPSEWKKLRWHYRNLRPPHQFKWTV